MPTSLIDDLISVVGSEHVLIDPTLIEPYATDWTRRWHGHAAAVVRPGSTQEVADVVRVCGNHRAPIIPQGGNTGLVAGGVPAANADDSTVIVSTRRLRRCDPVDQIAGQVTVGAGLTLADVQHHVRDAGWEYGVDLAARDSATIGGTVATNAGGIRVIAHGMTRAQVTGMEAVLPDGSIISHLGGLPKDNTGYDLAALLTGSEGTLGIITAVRLRLHRPHAATSVVLIGIDTYDQGLDLLTTAINPGVSLLAAEIIDETGLRLAQEVGGLPAPLQGEHRLILLLEIADGASGEGFNPEVLADLDVVIATDVDNRVRLWAYRELQSEAFSAHASRTRAGVAHKLDISIPLQHLPACAEELRTRMLDYPAVMAFGVFGHLGDGNIHVEISGPDADDEEVDKRVLSVVTTYGGSVSAEHGIGRAKTSWLPASRTAAEIAAMHAIKKALDPRGIMNPGALLPEEGS
jgi:FAD/FMN-containing dehydrogenase